MGLRKELSLTSLGWNVGAAFSPVWLAFEVAWETSPPGLFLTIPLQCLRVEGAVVDGNEAWSWGRIQLRLTMCKTEFRLDIDLNISGGGVICIEFDDCAIYVGPFNVQIETNKMFDVDFPPCVPRLRSFFPPGRSVQP
jgi:hypothetical protein